MTTHTAPHRHSTLDSLCIHVSRLGPFGCSPKAPGTAGSAAAMLAAPLLFMPLSPGWRVAVLLAVFLLGSLAVTRAESLLGKKDPGEIVLDELLGQWLTYLPFAALSWGWLLIGFVLFRVFDILKPYPVRNAEHWLPGGWGVMIDDVIAGLYAMLCLGLLRLVFA